MPISEKLSRTRDVTAGDSVRHLADVLTFAADLTRRGRLLPTLFMGPTGGARAEARWRSELGGGDLGRYEDLRRAMPGVALAGGGWSADRAVRAVLDSEVDRLARARLDHPLVPPAAGGIAARGAGRTAVRAWLDALTGPEAGFCADEEELRRLRDRLRRWHASAAPAAVRTCFRLTYLEEGDRDDEPAGWLLEFLLQPVAEPSVLIAAGQVWSDGDTPLFAWVDDPQAQLLADLGRASRLYPDLDEVLRERHPEQLFLDVAGAYRFLSHAPMLAEAGFGVLLPARWQQKTDLGLSLTVHSGQTTSPVLRDETANRDAIVDYRWGLALGEEFLSEADLVELARAKVALVRLRGRWVYLDQAQVAAGLTFLARGGSGQMTAGEAMRLTRLTSRQPLPITAVDGSGWLADLLAGRADERLALLDQPATLTATLRPYQRKGLSWLAFLDGLGVGALLADDMGLGKTVQLLALEAMLRERGPRPPTLVVCPMSVLGNWQREIERFTPTLKVSLHHGAGRGLDTAADLVLTTYNLVVRDIDLLSRTTWDRVVLDEAQHVKNSTSVTARAVRLLPARHRVALTGTPVENRLTELCVHYWTF